MATTRTPPPHVPPDRPDRSARASRRRPPDLEVGPGEAPRRPLAAGHVIVVVLVCFLVGGLLNAAGIRKTALGQNVGTKRDVSKLFADPLYDVSHFLHVDQLRQSLKNALGRGSDDDVNLALPSPTTTTAPATAPTTGGGGVAASTPTTTTQPVKKRAFSPAQPMSLWVGGDSLSITPGESIINIAPSTGVINIVGNTTDGHVATGLARPEVFNWPAHMAEVAAASNPSAYVLTIGSNDDQTLTGDGGGEPFGTAAWDAEYSRRVGGMMDQMTGDGKHVLFWVGIPITRNVARSQDHYVRMNDIYRTEAEKRPGKVVYIDIYDMFRAPDGGYADYLGLAGVQVRTPDGLHFTRAGGDMIADKVVKAMQDTFDLTSWQKSLPTTTTTAAPATSTAPGTPTTAKPKSKKAKARS